MKICSMTGKIFTMWGIRTREGGAFWQKLGGAFAGQSQPAPKMPGAGCLYEVPGTGAGAG